MSKRKRVVTEQDRWSALEAALEGEHDEGDRGSRAAGGEAGSALLAGDDDDDHGG